MTTTTAGELLAIQFNSALPEGVEWDERELAMLMLAQSQANDIQALEGVLEDQGAVIIGSTGQQRLNPVFAELRQQRLALSKILAEIKLPDEGLGSTKNVVKQRAANARWDRVNREKANR
jgi:hypothetical protein